MDWTDGPNTVVAVVAVLSMLGAFVAFVLSLRKSRDADHSAKRAEAAELRANDARDRAAAALEAIAAASQPDLAVRWGDPERLDSTGARVAYRARNIGTATARGVAINPAGGRVAGPADQPQDVGPQQSIWFAAENRMSNPVASVVVEWSDPDGTQRSTTLHL